MAARNVYASVPNQVVREVSFFDKKTGEQKRFFSVRIPSHVVVDGTDLAGGEFTSRFANRPARYLGEDYTDIPLLADKLVWVKVPVRDEGGNIVKDDAGSWTTVTHKIDPAALKDALDKARTRYLEKRAAKHIEAAPAADATDSEWDDVADDVLAGDDIDF